MGPANSRRIPRAPRYSGADSISMSKFRVRGYHPLWRSFPEASPILTRNLYRRSYNPVNGIATATVWALPRSLATTCGIIIIFSSCGYLDVSVPRVRSYLYRGKCRLSPTGFPIRTSAHQSVFATTRGFSQLITSFVASESHRHPPCALVYFLFSSVKPLSFFARFLSLIA